MLLESGALADPDSFERERAVYNALNNKIRNLLLSYDYSKTADPLQPWSSHVTSLLVRKTPKTSDITLEAARESFELHKFILSSRSPYFRRKFSEAPETTTWKLSSSIPAEAFRVVLRYLYLGDLPRDFTTPWSNVTEEDVFKGIDKLCKQLEIDKLWEAVLSQGDRRLARQRQQDEVQRANKQVEAYFRDTVLRHKIVVETRKADDVKWPVSNAISANCLLRADEMEGEDDEGATTTLEPVSSNSRIPIGPSATSDQNGTTTTTTNNTKPRRPRRSVLYPVHKAFLIRCPYFDTMFSSEFLEAQEPSDHLHIIKMDCAPEVLEIILTFLYTENATCPLEYALELLYAADMLLLDKLKTKAAVAISTLGNGSSNALVDRTHQFEGDDAMGHADFPSHDNNAKVVDGPEREVVEVEPINVYDVIHAAWELNVQRLEEFCARYLANRLEDYIDEEEFAELIRESASRLKERQETDTIELLDDIRFYLGERFRFRFEGDGLEEMLDEEQAEAGGGAEAEGGVDRVVAAELVVDAEQARSGSVEPAQNGAVVDGDSGEDHQAHGHLRTLDGEVVDDEFASDAINYNILLGKIDRMLERLKLDA